MLVVDGGSITYGDELKNKNDAWPYLIDKDVKNIALKGKSCAHIELDILNYYYTISKFDTCIIAWPNIIRNFVYKADTRTYIDFGTKGFHSDFKDKTYVSLYYKKYFCLAESLKAQWLRCLRLISWFKQNKIDWLMFNQDTIEQKIYSMDLELFSWFHNSEDYQIQKIFSDLKKLEKEIILQKNYVGFTNNVLFDTTYTDHPTIEQHKQIADFVMQYYVKNTN